MITLSQNLPEQISKCRFFLTLRLLYYGWVALFLWGGDSFETIMGLFAQPIDGDTLSSWVGE